MLSFFHFWYVNWVVNESRTSHNKDSPEFFGSLWLHFMLPKSWCKCIFPIHEVQVSSWIAFSWDCCLLEPDADVISGPEIYVCYILYNVSWVWSSVVISLDSCWTCYCTFVQEYMHLLEKNCLPFEWCAFAPWHNECCNICFGPCCDLWESHSSSSMDDVGISWVYPKGITFF